MHKDLAVINMFGENVLLILVSWLQILWEQIEKNCQCSIMIARSLNICKHSFWDAFDVIVYGVRLSVISWYPAYALVYFRKQTGPRINISILCQTSWPLFWKLTSWFTDCSSVFLDCILARFVGISAAWKLSLSRLAIYNHLGQIQSYLTLSEFNLYLKHSCQANQIDLAERDQIRLHYSTIPENHEHRDRIPQNTHNIQVAEIDDGYDGIWHNRWWFLAHPEESLTQIGAIPPLLAPFVLVQPTRVGSCWWYRAQL